MDKRTRVHQALASTSAILCAWTLAASGQGNPYEADPVAIRAGEALYEARCADCHGADAKGTTGPDLTGLWAAGASDVRVFESIRLGVEGSIMAPSAAPDAEIWAIVAYLRSVSTVPPFESDGDVERGRETFASSCACCHRVNGRGATLGPDLSRIALVRSRDALARAIRDPGAAVEPGYRAVTLVTRSGERIRGVVKSEDAFSIQIMDADERLQGYRKAELERVVHEAESFMPPFPSDDLGEPELEDLLAFLATLRAADTPESGAGR